MIGTLRETELHAALKRHYARPTDQLEVKVGGYVIDIVRGTADRIDELIEIQTHNFSALRRKLPHLLEAHRVRLVYPIPQAKWITRVKADRRTVINRRKSPQRGAIEDVFLELVSLPQLLAHPNFTLEVVLIHEEELRCSSKRHGRWGKDWRMIDHRLLKVVETITFATPSDLRSFIPETLPMPFTSRDLAEALDRPVYLGQKMTYCLRQAGVLTPAGKRERAWLYEFTDCGK
jgi:hypothetical protein